jgi:hypothetical protein
MIKNYSSPQSSPRKHEAAQCKNVTGKAKNPRKRAKNPPLFQDPSSPRDSGVNQYLGALVPYQASSRYDKVLDGTAALPDGEEVFKEHEIMEPWQMSHLKTESSSSPDSSSPGSRKRMWQHPDEDGTQRSNDRLRRSRRHCVQVKMFKHRDGVGAEEANPIFL